MAHNKISKKEYSAFDKAALLYDVIGNVKVDGDTSLRETLSLYDNVSLWDIIGPFLILYRFPLLFTDGKIGFISRIKRFIRPYIGWAAHYYDEIKFYSEKNTRNIMSSEKNEIDTLLFIASSKFHYRDVLLPIIEQAGYLDKYHVVAIDLRTKEPYFLGRPCCSIWNFWNKDVENSQKELVVKVNNVFRNCINKKLIINILSKSEMFSHIKSQDLYSEFLWMFKREFLRLIPHVVIAKQVLAKYKPRLIITADDADQRSRIYSLLGKYNRFESLVIQQGLSNDNYPDWRYFAGSYVAAMGVRAEKTILKQGVLDDVITVTGHPGFDRLLAIDLSGCRQIRKNFGCVDSDHLILFASQPFYNNIFKSPESRIEMIRQTCNVISCIRNTVFVIKPHPNENLIELRRICKNFKNVKIIDKGVDITGFIQACDIFVTMFSTTALQALYIGKPVLNIDFPNARTVFSPYIDSGATWIAKSKNEVASQIKVIISSLENNVVDTHKESSRIEFVKDWAYYPDGKAADRIIKLIENILIKQRVCLT